MLVQQTQFSIEKIINRVRSGRLALPDFQRDFVWSPSQVSDLLESICREWPIGSLLLLNGPQPFAFRAIDSAPEVADADLDLYVLDGQQRVTAIYHAIQNVSPFVYYVDFANSDIHSDEVILWERRSRFERKYKTLEQRAASSLALVQDFWENERFQNWLEHVPDSINRSAFVTLRERRLSGLQSKVYHLLAIELEQGIELEALAKIFETLNKTGVRLNAFDLLVAKLYPSNFNLREEWDNALQSSSALTKFDPDGLEIIKLVALLVRSREGPRYSKGVRQGDVLALDPTLISKYWHEAVGLYAQALGVVEDFGVSADYLMPSWSMVLGVVGCLLSDRPDMVRPWWMSRLRAQTFAQAANTRVVAEFDALVSGDAIVDLAPIDEFIEMTSLAARPNGLLLRGVMALIASSGARDPLTGVLLSDARRIEVMEVQPDGTLTRLASSTNFGNFVLISEEGRRLLKTVGDIRSEFHGNDALESQGMLPSGLFRPAEYMESILQ